MLHSVSKRGVDWLRVERVAARVRMTDGNFEKRAALEPCRPNQAEYDRMD